LRLTTQDPSNLTQPSPTPAAEGSFLGRFVAIITPFFALFAGWLAGVVAKAVPGVTLDKGQIVAFMIAVTTTALTAGWKWLQGWQQHEQNVADGKSPPRRNAPTAK
jgi:hypothetical protein